MPEKYRKQIISQKKAFSPVVVFILCALLTMGASFLAYRSSLAENMARFDRSTASLVNSFKSRMSIYINSLIYTKNLFVINPDLTEKEYNQFIDGMNLPEEFPGIQNIGYVKHVAAKDFPRIHKAYPPHTKQVYPKKPFYDIVIYVKSLVGAPRTAVGMDLSFEPIRIESMRRAALTGDPVASDKVNPITYSTGAENPYFIVFVPIYKNGMPTITPEQRERALVGYVYGGFRASYLFSELAGDTKMQMSQMIMKVYDGISTSEDRLMYSLGLERKANPNYQKTIKLNAANHSWTIELHATDGFTLSYSRYFPFVILLIGTLLTIAVTLSSMRADNFAAKLIEDIDQRLIVEEQLREEKQIVELVAKMATRLKAEQDLTEIVQLVTDVGTKLTNAKFGAFFYNVVNEEKEEFMLFTLSGADKSDFEKFGMPRNTPIFRPTFDGTGITRSDDIVKDPRFGTMAPHFGMPEGHLKVRSYLSAPVFSKNGKVLGGLFFGHPEPGVFKERSEVILNALALQAGVAMDAANLYNELDAANRAKSIFLANVSHEIRTPLGVMLGFGELIEENSEDPVLVKDFAAKIVRNGHELTRIIGDVLDLSKIEANTFFIENSEIDLKKFVDDFEATWRRKVEAKGLRFELVRGPALPAKVSSDITRLKQIFTNLISNALKFTEAGHIHMHLTRAQEKPEIHLTIEDTGPGIPESHQNQLFRSFSQGDSSITRKYGGSGLGLALSKQLARALQGDLILQKSEVNKGSTFLLCIPIVPSGQSTTAPTKIAEENADALKGVRVLVVDDSRDNQILIGLFLEKAHAIVDTASNGEEGFQKAVTGQYDVILMDIQMPVLDGYRAMEKLKTAAYDKPVIALTAHALVEEKKKALSCGFKGYLTKPVDKNLLVKTIGEAIG